MCDHCGCESRPARFTRVAPRRFERLQERVLAKNDELAARNRQLFDARALCVLNLMSSPGAGKTTLLTRSLPELSQRGPVAVIEADQASSLDAERIAAAGAPVLQINTGTGCHIEAGMLRDGVERLAPAARSLLFVENVGNLVCPALFDLGESGRVVLLSVSEGDDKPDKYPHMFAAADLVVITKTDLLPHVDFDRARVIQSIGRLNPRANVIELSARTGSGMRGWLEWLDARRPAS